jgi:hypothetical protein
MRSDEGTRSAPAGPAWSRSLKVIVSVAILFHLAAVIAPPLAGPPPASVLANRLMQPLRPYVGLVYLGHGYRFFAPDPGPGHSIRYEVTLRDGSTVTGSLPDAARDRPRLAYHRKFMVSEKISGLVPPADAPQQVRDDARRDWLPLVKGVARHLLEEHGGEQVELTMVEHFLPGPDEVLSGKVEPDTLTPLGMFARGGLESATAAADAATGGSR